jgi:hypothetical protein
MPNFNFAQMPPLRASLTASQRFRNSLLKRSRFSPVATATKNGLVFDHDGAVKPSVINSFINSSGIGVAKKSLELRLLARKSDIWSCFSSRFTFLPYWIYPSGC